MPEAVTTIPSLPQRPVDAHKGQVGRVLVIGGSLGERGMIGAPSLTANAALRGGCGLVQVATPREAMPFVGMLAPCATTRALAGGTADLAQLARDFAADVVAIGPGLGETASAEQVRRLLETFSGGIVVDADALNVLAGGGRWRAQWPHNVVLTPHPGEMRRLLEGWGRTSEGREREASAVEYAEETGVTVVLKGHGTVVTDGDRVYVNQTGNAGMATAGAGDVLTGIIAALIGQKMEAFDAAVLGVYVHGLAGDSAAEQLGRTSLTASDLLDYLPEAFCEIEQEQ